MFYKIEFTMTNRKSFKFNSVDDLIITEDVMTFNEITCASPSFVEDGCTQNKCQHLDCKTCWRSQKQYQERNFSASDIIIDTLKIEEV